MKKRKIPSDFEPELLIDGQEIKFHSSRKERQAKKFQTISTDKSFFNKKNRYIHIILIDLLLIFFIGVIFTLFSDKNSSFTSNNFRFSLVMKKIDERPILDFRVQIKNLLKENNILPEENRDIIFFITDQSEKKIYENKKYLSRTNYTEKELYSEFFFPNKPKTGSYTANCIINNSKLQIDFEIK